jgi:OOP family OmpA-OmpF porin
MKTLTAAATLLSLAALPVLAYGNTIPANPDGPYIGAGWGKFNLDIRNLNDVGSSISSISKGGDSNAWKLFGGWRFNEYLGIEAAYLDFGRVNDTFTASGSHGNYRIAMSGFAPYLVGTLPLGPFELFAKVGSYFYDVKVHVDLPTMVDSSHSRNDFLYGGGVGFNFFEHWNVRAEYETIQLKNAPNSDAFWLSTAWRF